MKNKCGKNAVRVTAIMLCGILFAGSVAPVYAAEENTPKDENVYVNLNQDGSVDGIYVVNAYRLDADTQIVDYGNYESVKNLTSDQPAERNGHRRRAGRRIFLSRKPAVKGNPLGDFHQLYAGRKRNKRRRTCRKERKAQDIHSCGTE